jgi:tetratricopeptide (TPR) repeat protein
MNTPRTLHLLVGLLLAGFLAGCALEIPQAGEPTPTPLATLEASALPTPTTAPSPTPVETPISVSIPPRPPDFDQYRETIARYLRDSGGDEDGLRSMLVDWGALRHVTDLLRVDVDDDGLGELLMVVVDPSPEYGLNLRGDLIVLDRTDEVFEVAYSAAAENILLDPALMEVDDLNGDGLTEMAFSFTECGAHTCFTTVHIVTSGGGNYQNLTGDGIAMSYVDPYFSDWDGDGLRELIMHGGTIGSVGAGPQRARTEVYTWDGGAYALSETVYDYSNYLYFRVLDANQALMVGEYERAATLYREAIDNPSLDVWMEESEREGLVAFSRYRLSLTYLLLGKVELAQASLDELLLDQPDSLYAQVAGVLWSAFQRTGNLRAACEEVGAFAASNPETAEVLTDYGYGNPTFTPEEVCPLGQF